MDPDCDFDDATPTDFANIAKRPKVVALLRKNGGKTAEELARKSHGSLAYGWRRLIVRALVLRSVCTGCLLENEVANER